MRARPHHFPSHTRSQGRGVCCAVGASRRPASYRPLPQPDTRQPLVPRRWHQAGERRTIRTRPTRHPIGGQGVGWHSLLSGPPPAPPRPCLDPAQATTLALLEAMRSRSIRVLDVRLNGFGLPAYKFAIDEWQRNCAVLEQLYFFSADPRAPDAQASLSADGLQKEVQVREAADLASAAALVGQRNRVLRRAAQSAGGVVISPKVTTK